MWMADQYPSLPTAGLAEPPKSVMAAVSQSAAPPYQTTLSSRPRPRHQSWQTAPLSQCHSLHLESSIP